MAIIINAQDGTHIQVADGTRLTAVAGELGKATPCHVGACKSCVVGIVSGAENLNEQSTRAVRQLAEARMPDCRHLCTAIIKGGEVVVDPNPKPLVVDQFAELRSPALV